MPGFSLLTFDLTYKCNLNCSMCHVPDYSEPKSDQTEMSLQDRIDCMNEAAEHGPLQVVRFLGGEPLLYPDLIPLIQAVPKGVESQIVTNGIMNPAQAKQLAESGLTSIRISIDGDEDAHDQMRGKGSWQKVIAGLDHLIEAVKAANSALQIQIGSCIHRGNEHCLESISKIAGDRHIGFVMCPTIDMDHPERDTHLNGKKISIERGSIPDGALPYTARENRHIRSLFRKYNRKHGVVGARPAWEAALLHLVEIGWDLLRTRFYFSCDRSEVNLLLDPWGNAYPCEFYYGYQFGHISEGGDSIWNGEKRVDLLEGQKQRLLQGCEMCNKQGSYRGLGVRIGKIAGLFGIK